MVNDAQATASPACADVATSLDGAEAQRLARGAPDSIPLRPRNEWRKCWTAARHGVMLSANKRPGCWQTRPRNAPGSRSSAHSFAADRLLGTLGGTWPRTVNGQQ
jgi:hypothetical protein